MRYVSLSNYAYISSLDGPVNEWTFNTVPLPVATTYCTVRKYHQFVGPETFIVQKKNLPWLLDYQVSSPRKHPTFMNDITLTLKIILSIDLTYPTF